VEIRFWRGLDSNQRRRTPADLQIDSGFLADHTDGNIIFYQLDASAIHWSSIWSVASSRHKRRTVAGSRHTEPSGRVAWQCRWTSSLTYFAARVGGVDLAGINIVLITYGEGRDAANF